MECNKRKEVRYACEPMSKDDDYEYPPSTSNSVSDGRS